MAEENARFIPAPRVHPLVFIKRIRKVMASIIAWLTGLLFIGVGLYIILLRFEGLVDRIKPYNMTIGQMTVDGVDSKSHAELLRARFDHHFRRPVSISKETGFLEGVTLDAPDLFQPKGLDGALEKLTIDVSGVDVSKILYLFSQVAKPDQWIVEGDFQTRSDRALLALRLRRGERLIRTWFLERSGNPAEAKSILLEQLIDDAIFQLVYDFGNEAEQDRDLLKWRRVLQAPVSFPSRAAVAAYYEALGALGRYYEHGDWNDLDLAVERLRTLRGQMPEFADGLQLLGMALAEKRHDTEAIHVYEQLRLLLLPSEQLWEQLSSQQKLRVLSIDLLKATVIAKLSTWQSAHDAIGELLKLADRLQAEWTSWLADKERAACSELLAQTAVQLAYTHARYLFYLQYFTVAELFGSQTAPEGLRVSDETDLEVLRQGAPADAKRLVHRKAKNIEELYNKWIGIAQREKENIESQWSKLTDGERRKSDLISRLHLAAGYANYWMAEWESQGTGQYETVFRKTFEIRLETATRELIKADAAHPNHYLVLQLLGLVNSEPRHEAKYLSIAEQYFERAIRANPSDFYGHELLAGVILRRVANSGIDFGNRVAIERGLAEAKDAIVLHEIGGTAHLLRAEFQAMLLEIERHETKRQELRAALKESLDQAERFLPWAFGRPDPDLTWMRIVAATRRLGEEVEAVKSPKASGDDLEQEKQQRFLKEKNELLDTIDELIQDCSRLKERWVAQQRVYHVERLRERAERLRHEIEITTLANWREIHIPFRQ